MAQAAAEEEDHLAWSAERVRELDGRTSLLNPLWYAGAFSMGALAGLAGDRWSVAFLAETERQVEEHLEGHLARLSPEDKRTQKIVAAMRDDERKHRMTAVSMGAEELPAPVRAAMRLAARVMTTLAYRV
jgi:3-demethoxyubiquinol 3-hydroxylase